MPSNMPPGYSDEGDAVAERGEETALYQELRDHFDRYRNWLTKNLDQFWTVEEQAAAAQIANDMEKLLCEMEGPL